MPFASFRNMRELRQMAAGEQDQNCCSADGAEKVADSAEQRLLVPAARCFNCEQASWISERRSRHRC